MADEQATRERNQRYLDKSHQYKRYGGLIPYLMKNVPGFRAFIYDQIFVKCNPLQDTYDELLAQFPQIPPEQIPALSTIRKFRAKMNDLEEENGNKITVFAMKDEARNMKAFGTLNLVEEEMEMYQKSKDVIEKVEQLMIKAFEQVQNMSLMPDYFWRAVENYQKQLEYQGRRLDKLDDLAIRYGFAPAKNPDMNLVLNQQNINQTVTVNQAVERIIDSLDIKNPEDLLDDRFFAAKARQASEIIYGGELDDTIGASE